jgi:hypothetical protein
MKKYLSYSMFFLAFAQLFCFPSCKKDGPMNQPETSNELLNIINSRGSNITSTSGDITVVAIDYLYGGLSNLDNFEISGYFKNSSGIGVPTSSFTVGNLSIPAKPNNHYSLHKGSVIPADNISQVASSFYGQNISYAVSSTDFGNVTTTLHMPTALNTTVNGQTSTVINKSVPLQINWQPDPYTGDGADDELVGVVIVYHAGIPANQEQEGLPSQNITIYKQANDGIGSVTFTSQELSVFPSNSYVNIYSGRAHQKIVSSSTGKTVAITNLVLTTTLDMKVQ